MGPAGIVNVLPAHVRVWTAAATVALCGAVLWRFGWSWELPAFLMLPLFGVLLAAIDLRTRLLPNALLLPFALAAAALLVATAALTGEWHRLAGAALGSASMFVLYLVMALISPGGLGMGDVKLAAVLGLFGGYAGLTAFYVTVLGGFILGGLTSLGLLLAARATRRTEFPFGPAMIAAALVGLLGFG